MGREALALLEKMRGVRVLCLGDVMLDRYIYGQATRISPEAPVPVVHVRRQALVPGGVGNVARNLGEFGVVPVTVSVAGDDANARILSASLPGREGEELFLALDPERPTIVKTRVVAGIQQVVRFDEEENHPLSSTVSEQILSWVETLMDQVGAVAVSDYGKGVMHPELMRAVVALAASRGRPVAIDPKGRDYAKYSGADLVKPNRKELAEASGAAVGDDREVAEAARELMRRHGIRNMLVTLSERGMLLLRGADGGREPLLLPSRAQEVFDVTGAGDTVLAAMAASMAIGASLETGARLATLAAGVVVGKVGTAVAHVAEMEAAARED